MAVHPLLFAPIFKPKLWGGRRLETLFGKPLPHGEPIGESWELADLDADCSIVRAGPSKGRSISKLVAEWGKDLLGRVELTDHRFPLLIKFLDAAETLSVQVHPSAEAAPLVRESLVRESLLAPQPQSPPPVKHEAWYVVDAAPGGFIYRGLKPGVDRDAFTAALAEERVEELLNRIPVRKGDSFYLPSGTIHALGAGVMVAEVQTPSDVTYRVYDFHRIDPTTSRPRELHIEQALECIDFSGRPIVGEERSHLASVWTTVTRLVTCESFVIERVRMIEGLEMPIAYDGMAVWIILGGSGRITSPRFEGLAYPFKPGDVVLLPAALKEAVVQIQSPCFWLEVTVPEKSDLAVYPKLDRSALRDPPRELVQINLPIPSNDDNSRD